MPSFSARSLARLNECHSCLQFLFMQVIQYVDCTIIEGHRGEQRQNYLYDNGMSKVRFPHGKHNTRPSLAVDAGPYEMTAIDWDAAQCRYFGGIVMGIALANGIKLRWGGDWDGDHDVNDQTFNDLVHFELIDHD